MTQATRRKITIAIMMVLAGMAFAQQKSLNYQTMQPYGSQPPFTAAELTKFMADWPSIEAWGKQHNLDVAGAESPSEVAAMFATADFTAFIQSKGWKLERFGYVAIESAICLGALELQEQMPDMEKQMKEAIDQVEGNPNLSNEQKTQTIQMMKDSEKQVLDVYNRVPKSEIDVVTPNREALKALFNENG